MVENSDAYGAIVGCFRRVWREGSRPHTLIPHTDQDGREPIRCRYSKELLVLHEAVDHEAVDHEAVDHEAVDHEAVLHEAVVSVV